MNEELQESHNLDKMMEMLDNGEFIQEVEMLWQVKLITILNDDYIMFMSSSSSSELDSGNGMERVGITLTFGLPFSLFRKVSLYHMGKWGHSCLLLAVDSVD